MITHTCGGDRKRFLNRRKLLFRDERGVSDVPSVQLSVLQMANDILGRCQR
jgi:hypothetical protein